MGELLDTAQRVSSIMMRGRMEEERERRDSFALSS